MQSYVYEAYPKVLYAWADNPTGWISVVVANEEEEGELNETWVPNPGAVTPPAP
jgi:methionyl-tRNA synthetase